MAWPVRRGREPEGTAVAAACRDALRTGLLGLLVAGCSATCDGPDGQDADRAAEADRPIDETASADQSTDTAPPEPICPAEARAALEDEVRHAAAEVDPCRTVLVRFPSWSSRLLISSACPSPPLEYCAASQEALDGLFDRLREPFAGRDLTCLRYSHIEIAGSDCAELGALDAAAVDACPDAADGPCWPDLKVVIDDSGTVAEVQDGTEGFCGAPEDLACLREALLGLRFPCLAGFAICVPPDWL
jgi:hypothetical protein